MSLLNLVLLLAFFGFVLWLMNAYAPIDGKVKHLINIVVFIVCIVIVLNAFGVFKHIPNVMVPQIK